MGPDAWKTAPVGVEVALRIAPDAARHPGPSVLADELAHLAADRAALVVEDVHVLAQSWKPNRARLGRPQHRHREEAGADLRPARAVHDRDAAVATHVRVEPLVRAGVPRLAGRDDCPE